MREDREAQGLATLRAYVAGDLSEPVVAGAFRDFQPDEVSRMLQAYRTELASINPARHAILESLLPAKH